MLNITSRENVAPEIDDTTSLQIETDLNKQELRFFIQSTIIKKYFESRHTTVVNGGHIGQIYVIPELPRVGGVRFDQPTGPLIINDDGSINLTMLRSVNLDQGITIIERGVPLTTNYVGLIQESVEAALRVLYMEYLRPIKRSVVVRFDSVS